MPSSPESETGGAAEPAVAEAQRDLEAELTQTEDRFKRALADLDNYRKRSGREVERRVSDAREQILRDWLEPVDSVERAMRMDPSGVMAEGLSGLMDQMEAVLARHGVRRSGEQGEAFDPVRHEAIGVRESGEEADRTIAEVARSGFELGDRVLRPAQVIVWRAPAAGET
jgi:molecular chaperone GrpE